MRTLRIVLLGVLVVAAWQGVAEAQGRPFGLGIQLGSPTGLTAKWYLGGRPFALQFGLGVIPGGWRDDDDGVQIHTDVIWHPVVLARDPAFTLPFYFGVGGRILFEDDDGRDDDDTRVGVRVPVGILMDFNRVPIDIFFEFALVVDLLYIEDDDFDDDNHDLIDFNATIGARYYF